MKLGRCFVGVLFILLLVSCFVSAEEVDDPRNTYGVGGEDVQTIQKIIDDIPFDDEGKIDEQRFEEGFKTTKSKAEERIDNINDWLDDNVGWLHFVFRMAPEISWLFACNLYVLLFSFVWLVLRNDSFVGRIFNLLGMSHHSGMNMIIGIGVFIIGLMTDSFLYLSKILYLILDVIWNWVIPIGFWVAILLLIIAIIVLIVLLIYAPGMISSLIRIVNKIFSSISKIFNLLGSVKNIGQETGDPKIDKIKSEFGDLKEELKQTAEETKAFYRGVKGK